MPLCNNHPVPGNAVPGNPMHTHTHGDFCSIEQRSDNFVKTFSMTIRITNLSKRWAATDAHSERDAT